ncbi:hypothetical protein CesoFtcFv8_019512 [Champsocephalus esox]|uniref:Uncharacterized protein n=1 Tax=Champsocephalus esox TaxID=159716 RepID=A0AAN8BE80_9TELE|nr:hypothetical protein CesoFtcFv8_019512 [Champsocephalus esox]
MTSPQETPPPSKRQRTRAEPTTTGGIQNQLHLRHPEPNQHADKEANSHRSLNQDQTEPRDLAQEQSVGHESGIRPP